MIKIDFNSYWMKNCRRNRIYKAKICDECPFREFIEQEESTYYLGL